MARKKAADKQKCFPGSLPPPPGQGSWERVKERREGSPVFLAPTPPHCSPLKGLDYMCLSG